MGGATKKTGVLLARNGGARIGDVKLFRLEPISKLKWCIIMHEVERCTVGDDTGALSGGKHS
jgi:hypothetical protein